MIAANNGFVLACDNLPGLPGWLSDALCRLASGGSLAVYEEVLFQAVRPILLNGIEDVISRPDDRAIFLTLSPIGEVRRRPEAELWREFETARPGRGGPARRARAWAARLGTRPARPFAEDGRFRPLG